MKSSFAGKVGLIALVGVVGVGALWIGSTPSEGSAPESTSDAVVAPKAMLAVTAVTPSSGEWARTLSASGSIAAWQEAIIGSELHGQRLAEVLVDVGDTVQKGQVLARFASDTVAAELAQQLATREEARAALAEAQANVARVDALGSGSGALSKQQANQYVTAELSARARLMSAEARVEAEQIRMRQTEVRAHDDGVISSRSATLGAVTGQGQELFRLIRSNRLEWRAEITSAELAQVEPGQSAQLTLASGSPIEGRVRIAAPTVDPGTRNAMVYVDLPAETDARAGMFASGRIEIGNSAAVTVPSSAVVVRDGYAYVFRIGDDGRVVQTRVSTGRRAHGRIELLDGIEAGMQLVDQGAGFLADGDVVQVVAASAPGEATASADDVAPMPR